MDKENFAMQLIEKQLQRDEYTRKKIFNLFEDDKEEALLAKIEAKVKVKEIKQRYLYPVKEELIDTKTQQIIDQ